MNIYIYAPDIHEGDAVGNHCLGLAKLFTESGYNVRMFAQRFSTWQESVDIRPSCEVSNYITPDAVLLVSYSIYDSDLEFILDELSCKKVCYFHNVTPPELLEQFDAVTAELCARSIGQLPLLKRFDKLVVNSRFSLDFLRKSVGKLPESVVIPPVFRGKQLLHKASLKKCINVQNITLISLGRVVPHKNIEETIRLLALLNEQAELSVHLNIVGSLSNPRYFSELVNLARSLDVLEKVSFTGVLSELDLASCLEQSDFLISFSSHEGFCIPVLEAMHIGLPVVLKAGTAADELAEGACLSVVSYQDAAEKLKELIFDSDALNNIIKKGLAKSESVLDRTSSNNWIALVNKFSD